MTSSFTVYEEFLVPSRFPSMSSADYECITDDLENSIEPSNPIEVSANYDIGKSDLTDMQQWNLPVSLGLPMGNSNPADVEQSELVDQGPHEDEMEGIEPATSPSTISCSGSQTDHPSGK